MNEVMVYGFSALLGCFFILTFLLSRIKTDVFPDKYEFSLDPFWYIICIMFAGGSLVYVLFPEIPDMIHPYRYINILLPFIFATIIYFCHLFDIPKITNFVILIAAVIISFLAEVDFSLFSEHLSPWQEKLIIALILFIISKGMGLLNGLGAVASMQFCAVMISIILLAYFGGLPKFFEVLAMAYLGVMIAFLFFSWPPEKLVISHGAFVSLGFIMGCFMLNATTEFAGSSMIIAVSYLITEIGIAIYNHFILRDDQPELYMSTSYYKSSNQGKFETSVIRGIFKILFIDILLSLAQISASDYIALPIFTIVLNLWFLSILSGDTKPEELLSITKFGKRAIKGIFSKKKDKK